MAKKSRTKGSEQKSPDNLNPNLSQERTQLAEERTLLSYIRTALAIFGVGLILARIFVTNSVGIIAIGFVLFLVSITIIYEEVLRLRHLRKLRKKKRKVKR